MAQGEGRCSDDKARMIPTGSNVTPVRPRYDLSGAVHPRR